MNRRIIVAILFLFVLFGFTSPVHANEKIALVSLQKALLSVNEGKKIKGDLQAEYETKKKQIDTMKSELEKMRDEIEKQQSVLSQEALKQKSQDLQAKFMDLQNKAATYERELTTKEAENAKRMLLKLRDVVLEISKKEGYTLVLENSTDTVLFSQSGVDITENVITAYNNKK